MLFYIPGRNTLHNNMTTEDRKDCCRQPSSVQLSACCDSVLFSSDAQTQTTFCPPRTTPSCSIKRTNRIARTTISPGCMFAGLHKCPSRCDTVHPGSARGGGITFGCLEYRFREEQHPGLICVPAVFPGSAFLYMAESKTDPMFIERPVFTPFSAGSKDKLLQTEGCHAPFLLCFECVPPRGSSEGFAEGPGSEIPEGLTADLHSCRLLRAWGDSCPRQRNLHFSART